MFKIGDIVWVDGELYDRSDHIVGKITNVFTHFIQIRTEKGTYYTVQKIDLAFVHLIRSSEFEPYSEKNFEKDIMKALKD